MGKPIICICENKDADQLRGNREADQRLCFRYSDSTIVNPKFQASSSFLCLYRPVCVGPVRKPHCWFFPRGGSFYLHAVPMVIGDERSIVFMKSGGPIFKIPFKCPQKLWMMKIGRTIFKTLGVYAYGTPVHHNLFK